MVAAGVNGAVATTFPHKPQEHDQMDETDDATTMEDVLIQARALRDKYEEHTISDVARWDQQLAQVQEITTVLLSIFSKCASLGTDPAVQQTVGEVLGVASLYIATLDLNTSHRVIAHLGILLEHEMSRHKGHVCPGGSQ